MSFGSIDQLLIRKEVSSDDTKKESTGYRSHGLLFIALAGAYFFFYGGSEVSIVHFIPPSSLRNGISPTLWQR